MIFAVCFCAVAYIGVGVGVGALVKEEARFHDWPEEIPAVVASVWPLALVGLTAAGVGWLVRGWVRVVRWGLSSKLPRAVARKS